jgi:hypothetical protein
MRCPDAFFYIKTQTMGIQTAWPASMASPATWPVDDNYVGRIESCTRRVREAGLPLDLRHMSKVNGMPGKRITDHQVHKDKQHRNKLNQGAAAAKPLPSASNRA